MSASGRHWAAINEVSFVAGMRLLCWVHRVLGPWPFRIALYPVLVWYVLTNARARRVSSDYLTRVGAFAPVPRLGVLRHFAAFAESILDKMLLWGGHADLRKVSIHGADGVDRVLESGRGALLICSHFGNIELCRVLSRQRPDVAVNMLVHTRHAEAFNAMLASLNPAIRFNLMQVTELDAAAATVLAEKVGRGELVVIAGDRVPVSDAPRVAMADFLGSPAPFPVGPYVLASVLQCPVFLLFPLQRDGRAEVHFELFSDSLRLPRGGRNAALADMAGAYAARLQHYCTLAPLQWFNFYDFWHTPKLGKSDAPG
ncbi:MAG TPA: acyltransferase [Telluria sp.]